MITYEQLKQIAVRDCGEPLCSLGGALPQITLTPNRDMWQYTQDRLLLRQGCIARLSDAHARLEKSAPACNFVVTYGYRHPDIQRKYFTEQYQRLKKLRAQVCQEEVHKLIAVPEVAGHPTGGAIDLTLECDGQLLDMGCEIAEFSAGDKLPTFSRHISATQRKNRLLLRSVMTAAGFAPFDGEWWHFSYGDREWAAYYDRPFALYDQLQESVDNSV